LACIEQCVWHGVACSSASAQRQTLTTTLAVAASMLLAVFDSVLVVETMPVTTYVPAWMPTTSIVVFQVCPGCRSPKEQNREEPDLVHPAAVPVIHMSAMMHAHGLVMTSAAVTFLYVQLQRRFLPGSDAVTMS